MAWAEGGWCKYGWCGDQGDTFALTVPVRAVNFVAVENDSFAIERPLPVFDPLDASYFDLTFPTRTLLFSGEQIDDDTFELHTPLRILSFNGASSFSLDVPKRQIAFEELSTDYFDIIRPLPVVEFVSDVAYDYFNLNQPRRIVLFTASDYGGDSFELTRSLPVLSFSDYEEIFDTFALNVPLRILSFSDITADEDIVVLVLNLDNLAGPTYYSNFNFEKMIQIGSNVYFKNSSGQVFKQGGNTDNGTKIDAFIELPEMDFGTSGLKTILNAYLSMNTDGTMRFRTKSNGEYRNDSDIDSTESLLKTKRVVLAKGFRERYHGVRLDNIDGSNFTLNELELSPILVSKRKGE